MRELVRSPSGKGIIDYDEQPVEPIGILEELLAIY